MDKYYNTNYNQSEQIKSSRMQKNEQLYQEINNSELDSINLTSNAHVIGDNDSFDVDKIKELIEKTYGNETPRKNKTLDTFKEEPIEIDDEEEITKEYDINAILKKAKIGKDIDYEKIGRAHV